MALTFEGKNKTRGIFLAAAASLLSGREKYNESRKYDVAAQNSSLLHCADFFHVRRLSRRGGLGGVTGWGTRMGRAAAASPARPLRLALESIQA